MMMTLLVLKSRIKTFYEKHYRITRGILKAVLVFLALLLITSQMDYSEALGQLYVIVPLALLCGFAPDMVSAFVLFTAMGWEMTSAVPVLGMFLLLLLAIYFLLLGRIERGQAYMIILIPLFSMFRLGCVIPIAAALFVSPAMLPAMLMGILLHFAMSGTAEYVSVSASAAEAARAESLLLPFTYIVDYLRHNSMFVVTVLAFSITFVCVYLLRRASFKYASQIAILVGTLVLMFVELFANILLDLDINPFEFAMQALIAMLIAYIVQFFRITLDYHGTRKLQFEDDEYYYYVTAIPKYKVAVVDKTVTRIVPGESEEPLDLKEELEKTLEEETGETDLDR